MIDLNTKIWLTVGWVVIFVFVTQRKKLFHSPSWLENTELAEVADEQGNFLPGMKVFFVVWSIFLLICMWLNLGSIIIIGGFALMMICQNIYTSYTEKKNS